jgi:hypothetical protein
MGESDGVLPNEVFGSVFGRYLVYTLLLTTPVIILQMCV